MPLISRVDRGGSRHGGGGVSLDRHRDDDHGCARAKRGGRDGDRGSAAVAEVAASEPTAAAKAPATRTDSVRLNMLVPPFGMILRPGDRRAQAH